MHRLGRLVGTLLAVAVVGATAPPGPTASNGAPTSSPTASARDLGALGFLSQADDVDGGRAVGHARAGDWERAVVFDLATPDTTPLDLGTLGGPDSQPSALDGDIVVGWSDVSYVTSHAFAVDLAAPVPTMRDLGSLGGDRSRAVAVDGNLVVGWSRTTSQLPGRQTGAARRVWADERAFAYDLDAAQPVMQDLGTLGGHTSAAAAVEGRVVVGTASTGHGQHAFALDLSQPQPVMQDLGTLGGRASHAVAISDGVVVGSSRTAAGPAHAFAYDLNATDPVMRDLGTLGGKHSTASAISQRTVVGTAETRHGGSHAFAYDLDAPDPVAQDLGTLGVGSSAALDIDGDIVVGWSSIPTGGRHAFAYDLSRPGEGMQDLRPLRGRDGNAVAVDGGTVVGASEFERDWTYHATAWTLGRTTRPVLAFSKSRYRVRERDGHVTVVVTRAGRAARAVSVRYSARLNSDLRSSAGPRDFRETSGTLRLGPGQRRGAFRVAIVDDSKPERHEDLVLVLRHPRQPAALGTPNMALIRIRANDRGAGR